MPKKIFLTIFATMLFLFPKVSLARVGVTDWYIKDFDSQIIANKDSSLDITETITADCGNAVGKHGIFRILPTQLNIAGEKIQTPVALLSITNEKGEAYQYQTVKNSADGTVTWKIGDANKTVQGVNVYVIHYRVKNAIHFGNQNFDELYWNLNGNFWDLQIDKFHAAIKFPEQIKGKDSDVDFYTGHIGSKEKNLATFKWSAPNVLEFNSTGTLLERQGITASVVFPRNIFTQYVPSFWELYGEYFFCLIPIVFFLIIFTVWKKYGKDPIVNKTVIAEYEIPENLSPVEAGMLIKSGGFDNTLITAEMIWLASRGLVTIKEVENKILFFSSKDYELTKNSKPEIESSLNDAQKKILENIFEAGNVIMLSSLKDSFYKKLSAISESGKKLLESKKLIFANGVKIGIFFKVLAAFLAFSAFAVLESSIFLGLSVLVCAIILVVFGFLMPKRTVMGAELNWKISGFKLFMETVDKDRAAFYEKENIFEKCLPYAILFGMTKLWIKKMQEIYGAEYFANHIPLWYVGNLSTFNADSFASAMDNLSADIATSTSAPSGSGGSGSSGGGGGGGGGGGW